MTPDIRLIVDKAFWVLLAITLAAQVIALILKQKMDDADREDNLQKHSIYRRIYMVSVPAMGVFWILLTIAMLIKVTV